MLKKLLFVALFGAFAACSGDDTGKDGTDDGTDGDGPAGDSCWFDEGLCFDYDGDTQAWCSEMDAQYGGVLTVEYSSSPCPGDEVGQCALSAGSGDFTDAGGTAYYYSPDYDASSAEAACTGGGGSFS